MTNIFQFLLFLLVVRKISCGFSSKKDEISSSVIPFGDGLGLGFWIVLAIIAIVLAETAPGPGLIDPAVGLETGIALDTAGGLEIAEGLETEGGLETAEGLGITLRDFFDAALACPFSQAVTIVFPSIVTLAESIVSIIVLD